VLVRHAAIGVNFIDVYHRTGLYPGEFPGRLGQEAAGTVEAVGPGVSRFAVGDRIAYATGPRGGYAEFNVVPEGRAVRVPEAVPLELAAASLLKGMTAEFLVRRTFHVKHGHTVLVHAAAGGVGSILTQWARAVGATVIGAVGSEAKADEAGANGCHEVIVYNRENVADRVRAITGGAGVPVVYDGVGAATFDASLASLARRGLLVSFGNASGPVPPVDPLRLSRAGSLYLTRPTLFDYVATTAELDESAAALFDMLASGKVKVHVGRRYRLDQARAAHEALQARQTTGSTILVP
jgi:NADPH2:quinone reductase